MMIRIYLILVFKAMLFGLSFGQQQYLDELKAPDEFRSLAGPPLTAKYGSVLALKVVYDVSKRSLYFINAAEYTYHHEFCRQYLGYDIDLPDFNFENYSGLDRRRFLLANINYFSGSGMYLLELSPIDEMTPERLEELYQSVRGASFFGSELMLLINSSHLNKIKGTLDKSIVQITPSELFDNIIYQPLSEGSCTGILRYELNPLEATEHDILLYKNTPGYLPRAAAVVLSEFQTPLSHMTILGKNRQIPVCAIRNVIHDSLFYAYQDKWVTLTIRRDTFYIQPGDSTSVTVNSRKTIELQKDLTVKSLVDIDEVNRKSATWAGNKAANFGELYRISQRADFKTPEGAFVIPFFFYEQHIRVSAIDKKIDNFLHSVELLEAEELNEQLKRIRKEVLSVALDSSLLAAMEQKIGDLPVSGRMRFRSSTNAEDAEDFSGAGLYTSKTGILGDSIKTIERAVKKVWASLWSYEAFMEREIYGIDHRQVTMAVLVHRSFPNEAVNGVVITKNLYRSNGFGFTVNAQIGDESVVKPDSGIICDQFICYPDNTNFLYRNKKVVDIITSSNLSQNELVMAETEIQHLANQVDKIKRIFYRHNFIDKSYNEYGLDIEFKLDGDTRQLYIKQVRVYND